MIGPDIVITIVDIRGDKVRLGIEAPTSVSVHREEVFRAIQRESKREGGSVKRPISTEPTVGFVTHSIPKGVVAVDGVRTVCCDTRLDALPLADKYTPDEACVTCKGVVKLET